ncbi:hypothetical protein ABW11_18920 [Pluralibacter gergoviae]|nr:hypothetical protein LG71_10750 [Pluralibacter gergoviae]KMK02489.1 hypothetical protein ABW08_18450 [Pluralibacter gergoviae]KMK24053.1 hypothetical protein ABW11_18920 [Pluralibacter gergoviae]
MQNIDRIGKFYGIDSAIGAAEKLFNHLQHSGATKTFQHFALRMFTARLSEIQGIAEYILHIIR